MNAHPEVTARALLHHAGIDDDRMLTFAEWCQLNGFSASTGQRLIASGQGPVFVKLSTRRKGVTVGENRRWQRARAIETAA
ncbi:helix-turn-helix transcriptional regulator [Bradyrhizobium diazoefficiens]|uniref:helix-turn-helix transcriptional regulator n=1 Tax=Bradyrhizobium diazoefficiens TaxID=1355477 RepID=UPI002714557A|nr:transcriptional regulator [Bradyrhizobium diazoefficiens]WLB35009.1 transcriptional regulator [Bradyrhizobium diazoefficiens]WLC19994.1 transcriptional regulator [Bradyrhizobium diazoefficiens]